MLSTKYISFGLHGFREEDCFNYKSMGRNDPQEMANLDHMGLNGRIYVGDHYTLLQTKYTICGAHDLREAGFFVVVVVFFFQL